MGVKVCVCHVSGIYHSGKISAAGQVHARVSSQYLHRSVDTNHVFLDPRPSLIFVGCLHSRDQSLHNPHPRVVADAGRASPGGVSLGVVRRKRGSLPWLPVQRLDDVPHAHRGGLSAGSAAW